MFESRPYGVDATKWKEWRLNRNRLPNLHLLEGVANQKKSDTPLDVYVGYMTPDQKSDFLDHAMIPEGVSLNIKDFDQFYEARKNLLQSKLRDLLHA